MTRSERACQNLGTTGLGTKNRQSLTYSQVSTLIGDPRSGVSRMLEPIQSYCTLQGLPPLTLLVVQQESGLPSSGLSGASAGDLASTQMRVFGVVWLARGNPNPDAFESAVLQHPSNGYERSQLSAETKQPKAPQSGGPQVAWR